jgi:cytochrome P450
MLSRHSNIYAALRAEVSEHFGGVFSESIQHTVPTFDNLKKLTLIQNIITETIRLFPPSATQARVATRDSILPTGGGVDGTKPIAVEKGTMINYSSYVLHRRRDLWGHDSEEWRPERWDDESLGKDGRLIFMGWGLGQHVCLGRKYPHRRFAQVLGLACPHSRTQNNATDRTILDS